MDIPVSTPPLENPLKLGHLHFESIAPLLRWNCKFSHPSLPTDSSSLGWWPNGIIFHQTLGGSVLFWVRNVVCPLKSTNKKRGEHVDSSKNAHLYQCNINISNVKGCVFKETKHLLFLGGPPKKVLPIKHGEKEVWSVKTCFFS